MNYNRERKATGKSCRKRLELVGPDQDYGPEADFEIQPDISTEKYEEELKKHFQSLPNTEEQRKQVFEMTIGQSSNTNWKEIRKKLLTASNFGKICKMRDTTSCSTIVKELLYSAFKGKTIL